MHRALQTRFNPIIGLERHKWLNNFKGTMHRAPTGMLFKFSENYGCLAMKPLCLHQPHQDHPSHRRHPLH